MRCRILQYSPTGGTARAARMLCSGLNAEIRVTELCVPEEKLPASEKLEEDVCVLAMPCWCGRVPPPAAHRLSRFRAEGIPVILLAVFGNRRYGDILADMVRLAEQMGMDPAAGVITPAQNSICPEIASGKPNASDGELLKQIGAEIGAMLESGQKGIPGARADYLVPFEGMRTHPSPERGCTGCGKCAEDCAERAITVNGTAKVDPKRCVTCMRCVFLCPQKCMQLPLAVRMLAGYKLRLEGSLKREPVRVF